MENSRLGLSFGISAVFHATLGAYVYTTAIPAQNKTVVLQDVDILVPPVEKLPPLPKFQLEKPAEPAKIKAVDIARLLIPAPVPPAIEKVKIPDIKPVENKPVLPKLPEKIKLAEIAKPVLPQLAPVQAPQTAAMDIKTTEAKPFQVKLPAVINEDKGALVLPQKINQDIPLETIKPADIQAAAPVHTAEVLLAHPIELEEVGAKAVALPRGIKFDQAMAPVRPQNPEELYNALARLKQAVNIAPAKELDADAVAPLKPGTRGLVSTLKPVVSQDPIKLEDAPPAPVEKKLPPVFDLTSRLTSSLPARGMAEEKKSFEIEGQISGRRIKNQFIPKFPSWAQERGITEAVVKLKFLVSPEGDVLPKIDVLNSSQYGYLDRVAAEALRLWKFGPIYEDQVQWGIITFRFLAE